MSEDTLGQLFESFVSLHERRLFQAHMNFDATARESWSRAFRCHGEKVLVLEATETLLQRIIGSVHHDGSNLESLIRRVCEKELHDVWALSGSSNPFKQLEDRAAKVAAAGILREVDLNHGWAERNCASGETA